MQSTDRGPPNHSRPDLFLCSSGTPSEAAPHSSSLLYECKHTQQLAQEHWDYSIHNRRLSCCTGLCLDHWSLRTSHSTHNSNFSL